MIKGLVAGSVNIALALLRGTDIRLLAWPCAAIVGLFGVGVSLVLFILALRHSAPPEQALIFLCPFVGAIIAIAVLHEPITAKLVIAGALMGLALVAPRRAP